MGRTTVMILALLSCLATGPPATGSEPKRQDPPKRVKTFAPEIVRVEELPPQRVRLSVSVLDGEGRPVRGLTRDDFAVTEAGQPQRLLDFGREADRQDRPLSAVFLVDRSESIGRQMSKWRVACVGLAKALRPIDEVRLATFTTEVTVLQDFTRDPARLEAAARDLESPGGGTRVFEAIERTLRDLRDRPGRKVVFLMTDGLDNDQSEAWTTAGDAYLTGLVAQAVRGQVTLVTILPGPTGRPWLAVQDMATQTGGWWLYPSDDLPSLILRLGERLLESYFVSWDSTSDPAARAGGAARRGVTVAVTRTDLGPLTVQTAPGLFRETPLLWQLAADLEEGDAAQRARAAAGLGLVEDGRAARLLTRALKDDDPRVRAAAATALGRRGDGAAAGALSRLLAEKDAAVRDAALAALQEILEKDGDPDSRRRILDALEEQE